MFGMISLRNLLLISIFIADEYNYYRFSRYHKFNSVFTKEIFHEAFDNKTIKFIVIIEKVKEIIWNILI